MEIYVVQYGDTIEAIANFYKVSVSTVIYDNQLIYPYNITAGQALVLPDEQDRIKDEIVATGYAYPFISEWTLEQTLPDLSELYVFSYGFTPDGTLIPPQADDSWIIGRAEAHRVLPILTLVPMGETGSFDNNLITAILTNNEARKRLIDNLIQTIKHKRYQGVNVDFEYIKAEDRDGYSAFIAELTGRLNPIGYQVSVALVPKTSDDQRGYLYEGMDYRALGEAANYVFLMTYEWGYTYSEPMAVAPINMVRRVVEYAVSRIPPEKILLGIPNYGYDWPLPFQRGVTRAQSLGNIEAMQQAIDRQVEIQYDQTAQTPHYNYWQDGVEHQVWFEDARSIQAKLQLKPEFGLKGIGFWHLMNYFRPSWLLVRTRFLIVKNDWY